MTAAMDRVASGSGREILLLSGEAGQGKTTIAAEAARVAFDDGACVLFGHCEEDLATPYQLFAEALGHYVAHAPEDRLRAHVEAHGSELAGLVSALGARILGLPPSKATDRDTERFLLFAAAVGLLSAASEHQLVVLVLEDLQWADRASLALLTHLSAAELATARAGDRNLPRQRGRALGRTAGDARASCGATAASAASSYAASTTPGSSLSCRRSRDTPSATTRWASPTPCTARPTATRSS